MKKASALFFALAHQSSAKKPPIEQPQDMPARLSGAANVGRLFHFRKTGGAPKHCAFLKFAAGKRLLIGPSPFKRSDLFRHPNETHALDIISKWQFQPFSKKPCRRKTAGCDPSQFGGDSAFRSGDSINCRTLATVIRAPPPHIVANAKTIRIWAIGLPLPNRETDNLDQKPDNFDLVPSRRKSQPAGLKIPQRMCLDVLRCPRSLERNPAIAAAFAKSFSF
jgi:hypothetical protein